VEFCFPIYGLAAATIGLAPGYHQRQRAVIEHNTNTAGCREDSVGDRLRRSNRKRLFRADSRRHSAPLRMERCQWTGDSEAEARSPPAARNAAPLHDYPPSPVCPIHWPETAPCPPLSSVCCKAVRRHRRLSDAPGPLSAAQGSAESRCWIISSWSVARKDVTHEAPLCGFAEAR